MDLQYIDKFESVVALMRMTGTYTATLDAGTIYTIVSSIETGLTVNDYVTLDVYKVRVTLIVGIKEFKVDAFGQALPLVGTWIELAPYSDYGTRKTINAKLLEKNGGEFAYQKYPLIALRIPTVISTVEGVSTFNANILIAHFTSKQYKPQERIENVFRPILWPLMYEFLDNVRRGGEFIGFNKNYDHIDRLFYGTEAGDDQNIANIFDDPLDAVEIRNLELSFLNDSCI